jgi:hypothetical protein
MREKVHLTATEWQMIKAAVNHGAMIPANSMREVLMGYQYALHQQKKRLLQKMRNKEKAQVSSAASRILREQRNNASYIDGGWHCRPEPNEGNLE